VIDSLAVLPFANAGGNADAEYLSDGITESLTGSLSGIPGLKVMSTSAVRKYKGQNADARQVAKDLGVRAVLTGRVAQRGDNLSVSAELVDARDSSELWGEHYDRKMADILTVQQEIAARISEKLRLRLSGQDKQKLAKQGTENPEAYQLYIKGKYFANKFTKEGVDKGLDYLRQAIALDPNYALAYDGLATYYSIVDDVFMPAREACPKGEEAARKLIALDDSRAEGHSDLGAFLFWYEYDWAAAEKEMKRAIELNPSNAAAHEMYGWLLTSIGRAEEGIAEGRKAQELEPLEPEHADVLGEDLYLARRYKEAADQFRKALDLDSSYWLAHVGVAQADLQLGKPGEAVEAARKARQAEPLADWTTGTLVAASAAAGNRAEAEKVLAELTEKAKHGWVPSLAFATAYLGLGDKPRALTALEKAYDERSWQLTFLKTDPFFDPLRSDPRFQLLLKRLNFPNP
jgi:TolB-like protein/Flp pilus assembly protein TadD